MSDRLLAEFVTEESLVAAIHQLRADGYVQLDAYTPFPSHDVEDALAKGRSRLPVAIFVGGLAAAAGAYFLQWLLVGHLYPLVVGERPPHFPLAFVIITFEMGVLFAALTAFFGTLALGRLVRLTDEVQHTPGFTSATRDRFWLEIRTADPRFDRERTSTTLTAYGATRIELPEVYP